MMESLGAALLARAEEDSVAARATLDIGDVTDAIVGFHAQQAVEKALKSVLDANEIAFPFTHDIRGLIDLCAASGIAVDPRLSEDGPALTPYAVQIRYGASGSGSVKREEAVTLAEVAVAWARDARRTAE
ncbi:MAG: HEPN domain-containing protein [Baekduia sp.]